MFLLERLASRSTQLIFNQDFQGLYIYIIILVLCCGDQGAVAEIRMTFSFMKHKKTGRELKVEQSHDEGMSA